LSFVLRALVRGVLHVTAFTLADGNDETVTNFPL